MGSNVGHKWTWHTIGQEPAELLWISAEHLESMKVTFGLEKGESLPVGQSRTQPSGCKRKIWRLNDLMAEEGVYPCQYKRPPGGLGLVAPYRPEAWISAESGGIPAGRRW